MSWYLCVWYDKIINDKIIDFFMIIVINCKKV